MNLKVNQDSWLVSLGLAFAWLAASILAVLDGMYIRLAILNVVALLSEQYRALYQSSEIGLDLSIRYAETLLDSVLLLLLGLGMIVAVIWVEYYFRKGRQKGVLLKRLGLVFGIQVAIIVVSIVIRMIVVRMLI